jgi:hypothetical protein
MLPVVAAAVVLEAAAVLMAVVVIVAISVGNCSSTSAGGHGGILAELVVVWMEVLKLVLVAVSIITPVFFPYIHCK